VSFGTCPEIPKTAMEIMKVNLPSITESYSNDDAGRDIRTYHWHPKGSIISIAFENQLEILAGLI
jgi:hypothetical protein